MGYEYSDESRASEPHALPDVEVFLLECSCPQVWGGHGEPKPDAKRRSLACEAHDEDDGNEASRAGWYFAFGFPGCLWDGEPDGPYLTEAEAIAAARDAAGVE